MKTIVLLGATVLLSGCTHTARPPAEVKTQSRVDDVEAIDPLTRAKRMALPNQDYRRTDARAPEETLDHPESLTRREP